MDVIDDTTFEYKSFNVDSINIGGFDWSLQFAWIAVSEREKRRRKSHIDPVRYTDEVNMVFLTVVISLVNYCKSLISCSVVLFCAVNQTCSHFILFMLHILGYWFNSLHVIHCSRNLDKFVERSVMQYCSNVITLTSLFLTSCI